MIETERLLLREYRPDDFDALYEIMSDSETMQPYPAPFDETRTRCWIEWNIENYAKYGFGLWAVVLKETGEFIGDCGITIQKIDGENLPEIGYHIHKKYWRRGFAKEAALAVRDWAFENTDYPSLYSYCKYTNEASYKTAEAIGMHFEKEYEDEVNKITHASVIHRKAIIKLIEPCPEYADEVWAFRAEILEKDADNEDRFAGCMSLNSCSSAEEWIHICELRKSEETCGEVGTEVPSTTYLAIRQSDNRLVGIIDLRHHINHPILGTWGGHCGYSVRPSERGKGYAKEMLRLNVKNAGKRGIEKMLVTCDSDNTASEKTILANSGVFESTINVDGTEMKRYWINVSE